MAHLAPVSIRVSSQERRLLEAAAEQARSSLSDFICRKAVEAAEMDLLQRNRIVIPAESWDKFEAWLASPAKDIPALRKLLSMRPVWQDGSLHALSKETMIGRVSTLPVVR